MELDYIRLVDVVDPHLHLRKGAMARLVTPCSTSYCTALLPMPNMPRLFTGQAVLENNAEINAIMAKHGHQCDLIGCIMLDQATATPTTPETIIEAVRLGIKYAKLYFIGTTTGATGPQPAGVYDLLKLEPVLRTMEEVGMTLLVHGEKPGTFVLDRERSFLGVMLEWLLDKFPSLRVVLEHITTAEAAHAVMHGPETLSATITPHHMYDTLDVVIGNSCNVHSYCKPSHQTPRDQSALIAAATSGNPKFRLGSDSAPHTEESKVAEGCAGCFTAPFVLPMLAEIFCKKLSPELVRGRLQAFVSDSAVDFYGVKRRGKIVELYREKCTVPTVYKGEDFELVPYRAGHEYSWSLG